MKIVNKGLKKGYLIHETPTGVYSICRILKGYDNKFDAINDIARLLGRGISENKLLK